MKNPKFIYQARFESRNFEFEAYGWDEASALAMLARVLAVHCQQNKIGYDWFSVDEFNVRRIECNGGYRDKQAIA